MGTIIGLTFDDLKDKGKDKDKPKKGDKDVKQS